MIEINLLPGGKKRSARRGGGGISLPSLSVDLPDVDKWLAFIVAGWVVGLGLTAWLFLGSRARAAELEANIAEAVEDSARYADIISQTKALQARRDTIAQKLEVIQEIDAGRYTWSHIMDEVSRAVPDYTWLTGLSQLEGGSNPKFQIQGRTGNNFALTRFMRDLEASPFLREVRLASTERIMEDESAVNSFVLEASYEDPPPAIIESEPLFEAEESDGTAP